MIIIVRFRFSTGRWVADFYDKRSAGEDLMSVPIKWAYVVNINSYPNFPKARDRLDRSREIIDSESKE